MDDVITAYNDSQADDQRLICDKLAQEIHAAFDKPENKLWHGAPVWFLDGNPIVGYSVRKDDVQLMFWSGQSFDESGLTPTGSFKAAEARYTDQSQIKTEDLSRWLKKSETIQWDYKNIVKRRGELIRLK